jgi:cysteine desulfurase family protein (TIGR01976 family)
MLDVAALRRLFPALAPRADGQTPVFFDGPAGTQVPQHTIAAMVHYLFACNANTGGQFATSRESDRILQQAHELVADFLNAPAPEEVIFGPNMTTLTFHLSRAVARVLRPGDEVLVTRLDHDANIRPWVLAARDAGATIRWVDIHPEDCTLDLDDLKRQLTERTRLVAVTAASNLVGSKVDVATVVRWAHAAGAWAFIDAVHFAPHGLIDIQEWDCDFLACSAYKFFGPHVGILWGRRALLGQLPVYKLRPATEQLPGRWMTGTQNHEGLAGLVGAMEYLLELGSRGITALAPRPGETPRRRQFRAAAAAIHQHEHELALRLLQRLAERPRFKIWGITAADQLDRRVPTFAISHAEQSPAALARHLGERHICTWNGNMYAVELTERLGLEPSGGLLRIGVVHYNTVDEVDRLLAALDEI